MRSPANANQGTLEDAGRVGADFKDRAWESPRRKASNRNPAPTLQLFDSRERNQLAPGGSECQRKDLLAAKAETPCRWRSRYQCPAEGLACFGVRGMKNSSGSMHAQKIARYSMMSR